MNNRSKTLIAGIALLALAGVTQAEARGLAGGFHAARGDAGGAWRSHHRVQNADGATAAGGTRAWRGHEGAGRVGARGYRSDGQGNAQGGHFHAAERPNGNTSYRGGQFQTNADGSASREAQAQRNTQYGTVNRSSQATRDAEGNTSYQRDTTITGANGNTAQAQVTRENGTVTRSVTCNGGDCSNPAAGQ